MRTISLILFAVLVAGCAQQTGSTEADVEAITALFAEAGAAAAAGDVDRTLASYADDAISMPPDMPPNVGTDAMRAAMQGYFDEYTFELTTHVDEVQVMGDIAYALASWSETMTPKGEGEVTQQQGKWIVIFQRQADGSWKNWREMWTNYEPGAM